MTYRDPAEGAELIVIRHAPVVPDGRLAGRRDVAAVLPDAAQALRLVRAVERVAVGPVAVAQVAGVTVSPLLRCRMTADLLFPDRPVTHDARLAEQDFGQWEGMAFADLPDLGPLEPEALAAHRPPGGESFADLCHRVLPALDDIAAAGGRQVVVAHAGTVRAALARATGSVAAALAFQIAPLSITRFHILPSGDGPCALGASGAGRANWSVGCVNFCIEDL